MPFVSDAQRKACFAQMRRYNEMGLVSPWDCHKFAKGEKSPKKSARKSSGKKSARKSSGKKSARKSGKKSTRKSSGKKVFTGARGGKYKIVRNRKVYL